ncbi:hypothetical protein CROQUDRAFT_558018 [Cronartium quercuum f. sp. fusiforme G11]|uniref:Uncharacterized protein n=1 Tax=Cronartium quercuum f. sp. fusiforme G11 TaxID=708437 RepID=A0A9P6NGR0_9BASI|nr:hypothetical protein CROQUDRAFT_558018 [Cronartium quercuum f. sp. fusiforme G11]
MITLVVKSSRASLSRILNNGLIIEHSKPISSLALSVKTITTLCCFLILITNSIASQMELTKSLGWRNEIEDVELAGISDSELSEDSDIEMWFRIFPEQELDSATVEERVQRRIEKLNKGKEKERKQKETKNKDQARIRRRNRLVTKVMSRERWEAIYTPHILNLSKRKLFYPYIVL